MGEQQLATENAEENHQRQIVALEDLFADLNGGAEGTIDEAALTEYLEDRTVRSACARVCKLSSSDLIQVFRCLAADGEGVDTQKFIEVLAYVGNPITEKSVMKLEACLNALQRRQLATESCLERLAAQLSNLEWRNCKETDQIMGRIQVIEK